MRGIPILTLTVFMPVLGALAIAVLPQTSQRLIRATALATSILTGVAAGAVVWSFDRAVAGFQMVEKVGWASSLGSHYLLGVDGISLWMVALTGLLFPVSILASWGLDKKVKAFHVVVLLLETGILGVFLALDLLLFYVFWEGMLIPMYFLIGIWGYERRVYAAVKFFLYTLAGSLLMLVGVAAVYFLGGRTFDLTALTDVAFSLRAQTWLFLAFFASFAIKVPIFPFHTWLPDAHTEAPTAGSVVLAGVLLKMGAYGFLRFSLPLFPDASMRFAPWLALLGVIGIVYGGAVSIVQKDLKKLIAYSSVSHLGFVVLGIAAIDVVGTSGAVLQMVSHGLSTGVLFLMVGMVYQRGHTRQIADLSGLGTVMPVFAGVFLLAALSSLGLPGLNGFVGEFLILVGSFDAFQELTIVATSGVILAAIYLLWSYERVFMGPAKMPHMERARVWHDITKREVLVVAPLVVAILFIGLFPKPLLDRIEPSVAHLVGEVRGERSGMAGR